LINSQINDPRRRVPVPQMSDDVHERAILSSCCQFSLGDLIRSLLRHFRLYRHDQEQF